MTGRSPIRCSTIIMASIGRSHPPAFRRRVKVFSTGRHISNTGVDPDSFVNTRLFDDMALEAFVPESFDDCEGKHLDLQIGPRRHAFTLETFILSFSQPNSRFHAVTAYTTSARERVRLGKRDSRIQLRTSSF